MSQAQKMLSQLYQDKEKTTPRLDITEKELDALQTCIEKMTNPKEKKPLEKQYQKIKSFYHLQQTLNHFFDGDVIKKEITKTDLLDYQKKLEKRSQIEQSLLIGKLNQGFIHSIFDLEPRNVTHWIAPDALARFGSQYATTTNISGSSPEQLKEYINQRKPVVVYTTSNFNYPSTWDGEVPLNLHVVLLTGYNRITGSYIRSMEW